jgi:aspartokinase
MEQAIISGVAHDRSEAKITVVGVPDKVGEAAAIFRALADAQINIDMIVQNVSAAATALTDISFTLPRADGQTAMTALARLKDEIGFERLQYDDGVGKVSIVGAGMRSSPGITATFFRALADAGVNIDMIVQNVSAEGHTDISFTLPKTDLPATEPILEVLASEIGAKGVLYDPDVAKVSLIGAGMKSHPGVAADMFEALGDAGINIEIISTSSIRVSCVVRAAEVERAVQAVHDRFRGFAEERVGP